MKGKEHERFAIGLAIFFLICFIIFLSFEIPLLSDLSRYIGLFWFIMSLILFIIGSLLPDSDSENMGSYIYFKKVFLFAYLFKGLEIPISKFFKRSIGHRQSLHTIFGIAVTSTFLIMILSMIFYFFNLFEWKGAIMGFIFLFLGQFIHLVCDLDKKRYPNWKIKWK